MSVYSEFYKHINFGSPVNAVNNTRNRYVWVKFGSAFKNEISSIRASAAGNAGHVYSFMDASFTGHVRSLNMKAGWTSWWSYVGDADNDDIESAIVVNRSAGELVLSARDLVFEAVKAKFKEAVQGTRAKTKGDPRLYVTFWPGYDPTKKFLSIQQDLTVELDWWWDYDARVTYDVYLYLNSSGKLKGYVAWVHDWVEGGIFSGDIYDELHPKLMAGAAIINTELNAQLALLEPFTFSSFYYLPGPPPDMNTFGEAFDHKADATLVLK